MPQRITLLTPLDDVLARIAGCVNPIGAQWIDDLASILGRTVAEDIRAEMPLPRGQSRCVMDGPFPPR